MSMFDERVEAAAEAMSCRWRIPKEGHPKHEHCKTLCIPLARAALEAVDAVVTEEESIKWKTVVLGRENPTDESSNWEVTAWKPEEIDYARAQFPGAEYTIAEMKLRGGAK